MSGQCSDIELLAEVLVVMAEEWPTYQTMANSGQYVAIAMRRVKQASYRNELPEFVIRGNLARFLKEID